MTLADHDKHPKIARPDLGEFGRKELAILGTNCSNIRNLVNQLANALTPKWKVSYVDAEHAKEESEPTIGSEISVEFLDKISFANVQYKQQLNKFHRRNLFNDEDVVLVNGNHFTAANQIVVIDGVKSLEKKLDKLTNVRLVLVLEGMSIPEYLQPYIKNTPQIPLNNVSAICDFVDRFIKEKSTELLGLVLAGGKSQRMKTDKGDINYFGKSQRLHTYELLKNYCDNTYISYATEQNINIEESLPVIVDSFTDLGPYGGILSAFKKNPNAAWLTVACDLPFLSSQTLDYLIDHRNPSKIATAFINDETQFPEPLITIWEPKSYLILLQFLSQGYSCPRKALINSDIELINAPEIRELTNVNYPDEKTAAMQYLQNSKNL